MPARKMNEETHSERGARVGQVQSRFQEIRLAEPRQHQLIETMEQLRVSGLNRAPGAPTRGIRVIQPSGAGKSEAAKQFVAFVSGQEGRDPDMMPVLHATLETTGTPKSLLVSCLEQLGDEYATEGTESLLLKRLRKALEEKGVEIIIIDELNHCSQKIMGKDVSNTLKNMLTKGWAPIVMMGTDDANRLFRGNKELRNRCSPQLSLTPLDADTPDDLQAWIDFLAGMDAEIVARKLLPRHSGLAAPALAEALCRACNGLIGELSLVLEDALCAVVRRGGRSITVADLHRAVDVRYVLEGEYEVNPLEGLVR